MKHALKNRYLTFMFYTGMIAILFLVVIGGIAIADVVVTSTTMTATTVTGLAAPSATTDATNKAYVDAAVAAAGGNGGIFTVWGSGSCPYGTLLYSGAAAATSYTPWNGAPNSMQSGIICVKNTPDNIGNGWFSGGYIAGQTNVNRVTYYDSDGTYKTINCAVCSTSTAS